jgi:class 3 adenylate cyclase
MSDRDTPGPFSEERRLAAVVFTDVVGYSARMQREEERTLGLVRSDFSQIETVCLQHGGSVLNRMGDGLLLCFPSAVQAVKCALEVQTGFAARKKTLPADQCLDHRVGIHLGDIFNDGVQVAGDGVNIAARLQTRAVPGGICVSQTVHDTVKGKISVQAVSLGPHEFKNIAEPIRIFHLSPTGGPPPPVAISEKKSASVRRMFAMAAVLTAGIAVFMLWPDPQSRQAESGAAAASPLNTDTKAAAAAPTASAPIAAAPLRRIMSTFDLDMEGWTLDPTGDKASLCGYETTIGNPPGAISLRDGHQGRGDAFMAPPIFLGDKSAYYGGVFSYDLRLNGTSYMRSANYRAVIFETTTARLLFELPAPTGRFKTYRVPLKETQGWTLSPQERAPTRDEFLNALRDITAIKIIADYRSVAGNEFAFLDNVALHPPEQPGRAETAATTAGSK